MKSDLQYKKIKEIYPYPFSLISKIMISTHPYEIIKVLEVPNEQGISEPLEDWNPEVLDMLDKYFGISQKDFLGMESHKKHQALYYLTKLLLSECDLNIVNKTNSQFYARKGFENFVTRFREMEKESEL